MRPRIAIPVPHSGDPEYVARALPQYVRAVEMAGGEAVPLPLDQDLAEIARLAESCDGVLLPGSGADVDPDKYNAVRHPKTDKADAKRETVDESVLRDAYVHRKPVLGICYGLQMLNVYCRGSLVQHIESEINHEAGRMVPVAHSVVVDPDSRLGGIVKDVANNLAHVPVNSSHHQSAEAVGRGLRISARCPDDGVVEAIEGTAPDHFVLAVQWHPERSVDEDAASRAIFSALIQAAESRHRELVEGTTAR